MNRNSFLTVLEAEKSKIQSGADWVSGEGCNLLPKWCLCCVLTEVEGPKGETLCSHITEEIEGDKVAL
jgi:hypothetical protein